MVNRLLVIQGLGVLRSWYSIWRNQLRLDREKQRQQINDEACAIYQDVYECVVKI